MGHSPGGASGKAGGGTRERRQLDRTQPRASRAGETSCTRLGLSHVRGMGASGARCRSPIAAIA